MYISLNILKGLAMIHWKNNHWLIGSGDVLCLAVTQSHLHVRSQLCFPDKQIINNTLAKPKTIKWRVTQCVHNRWSTLSTFTLGFSFTFQPHNKRVSSWNYSCRNVSSKGHVFSVLSNVSQSRIDLQRQTDKSKKTLILSHHSSTLLHHLNSPPGRSEGRFSFVQLKCIGLLCAIWLRLCLWRSKHI